MKTIEADGVRLTVEDGMFGPEVRAKGDVDALGFVLNNAARGLLPDLKERLQRGEETSRGDLFVERPHPLEDNEPLRARWERLSGRDPGDDVYLIGVGGLSNVMMIPRLTLLRLYEQLEAIRRDWVPPPPAPTAPPPAPPAPTTFGVPDAELADLDRRAQELDALARAARTIDEHAAVAAKRQFLLADLRAAGVFDEDDGDEKARLLASRGLAALEAYRDAAARLRAYLGSEARRRYLPEAAHALEGAPVSLDWFRTGVATPEGFDPDEWIAYNEYGLSRMADRLAGGEGDLFTGGGGMSARLFWRKDDGVTPALLRAELRRR